MFPCFEIVFDLIKNPRISNCCTTNHNPVDAVFIFILQCFFRRIDITVPKNRHCYSRIIFYSGNVRPICMAFVHLGTSSSVNAQSSYANILQTLSNLINIDRIIIPSQTGFYRYGQMGAIDNGFCQANHQINIF